MNKRHTLSLVIGFVLATTLAGCEQAQTETTQPAQITEAPTQAVEQQAAEKTTAKTIVLSGKWLSSMDVGVDYQFSETEVMMGEKKVEITSYEVGDKQLTVHYTNGSIDIITMTDSDNKIVMNGIRYTKA
jgi:hypothetical protein